MVRLLDSRREESTKRLNALRSCLSAAAILAAEKACVYVTGSFGRGEASPHSDLDLFIVGRGTKKEPAFSRLDQICLKADLIAATRDQGFPPFSGDGQYLEHYTIEELTSRLGLPHDDSKNTLTARLLLLLESRPLIGHEIYDEAIDLVVAKYWRDYEDHRDDFMPAFLANDILRLWRTFCLNYEARTLQDPPEKKAKRRLKNYKLKHSRLLTCFSALAYLLAVFCRDGTVSPAWSLKWSN
jgi:predicted nucleotidyltransferase